MHSINTEWNRHSRRSEIVLNSLPTAPHHSQQVFDNQLKGRIVGIPSYLHIDLLFSFYVSRECFSSKCQYLEYLPFQVVGIMLCMLNSIRLFKGNFYLMGLPCWPDGKESACNARDLGLIPGSGRSPGEGNGYPLQHSCLENTWTENPGGLQSMGLQRIRCD